MPTDMGTVADYTHLTALRAGRPTLLTYNAADDCCFRSGTTLEPLLAAARPAFAIVGAADKLRSHVNHVPGTHNFEQENREQFYAMLADFFYPADATFQRAEIPSRDDVKTADDLHVPLPPDNVDFHRPAVDLLAELPHDVRLPTDRASAEEWQRDRRARLASLLRVPHYKLSSDRETAGAVPGCKTIARLLRCGESWTLPCVELVPQKAAPKQTVILVADAGRGSTAKDVQRLITDGCRVLVVDALGLGESKVQAQDPSYLYPLFLAAIGERPLGIQACAIGGDSEVRA